MSLVRFTVPAVQLGQRGADGQLLGYIELLEKKKAASFTLTPKLWIEQTKAIGIVSRQGKSGGTFAHPMIACEFASWIAPEFKMLLLKLSLNRTKLS